MIRIIEDLLSKQDPARPHTLLTRLLVSFCIVVGCVVLYGFYGVLAAIAVYLLGVELMGLPLQWMFYVFFAGLLSGCWVSYKNLRDYWQNFGHSAKAESGI